MGRNRKLEREVVLRTLEQFEALEANLKGPEQFADLIDKYRESIADGTWEFMGTDDFVGAQAIAAKNFRSNCEAQDIACPEPPTWQAVGLALSRAMTIA